MKALVVVLVPETACGNCVHPLTHHEITPARTSCLRWGCPCVRFLPVGETSSEEVEDVVRELAAPGLMIQARRNVP